MSSSCFAILSIFFQYFYFKFTTFSLLFFVDWTSKDEDDDEVNVWEDNWDDENAEDDFNLQLR